MDILKSITACLCGTASYTALSDDSYDHRDSVDVAADDFVSAILTAEKPGGDLDRQLGLTVRAASWDWQESFAKAVLGKLEVALRTGVEIGLAATEAVGKAVAAVEGFAKEHPVYFTLIALAVLVLLSPWVIEALGFGELGPIEGMSVHHFCSPCSVRYKFLVECQLTCRVRDVCCGMAAAVCGLRPEGLTVCLVPASGHGLEALP